MTTRSMTPTLIARAAQCLHSWDCECHGDASLRLEPDAGLKLIIERGIAYEREVVAGIAGGVAEPDWDGTRWEAGREATLQLMRDGAPWIYQGVFIEGGIAGLPDLLKKVDGASELGAHSYMPVDIKGHKKVVKKDRFQLQAYAHMLDTVLGHRPDLGGIWLNTGEIADVDLAAEQGTFESLLASMRDVAVTTGRTAPVRIGECGTCPWSAACWSHWQATESVCLLYGGTGATARKLIEAGLRSWRDVAPLTPDEIAHRASLTAKSSRALWEYAQAFHTGRPYVRAACAFPTDIPVHFYDIETYEDCTYLHGNIRVVMDGSGDERIAAHGDREEKQFLARAPGGEKAAWHAYLEYLARDEEAIVYCWSDYEREFVKKLWDAHGGNEAGYKHLRDSLVDQCKLVRDHYALAVHTYSIKKVAPLFGFAWSADDAGGLNSESWYGDWLETGDEAILEKLLKYNLDDVVAMEVIDRELRGGGKRQG